MPLGKKVGFRAPELVSQLLEPCEPRQAFSLGFRGSPSNQSRRGTPPSSSRKKTSVAPTTILYSQYCE